MQRLRVTIVNIKFRVGVVCGGTCNVTVIILFEIVRDVESLGVLEIRLAFGLMLFAFNCCHAVVRDKLEAPFDWIERAST